MAAPVALTQKQARFVDEYMVDGNGARAAVAAGYGLAGARVRAHRLTRDNKAVMAVLEGRQAQDSQRLQIDREGVIAGLLEAISMAKAQGNPAAMISGLREIGRMLGFYEPERRQVELAVRDGQGPMERMTDAELMAVIAGGELAV